MCEGHETHKVASGLGSFLCIAYCVYVRTYLCVCQCVLCMLPKSLQFGWLPESRPRCGPRRRRRDVIRKDLKDFSVAESKWYEEAGRSRAGWRANVPGWSGQPQ